MVLLSALSPRFTAQLRRFPVEFLSLFIDMGFFLLFGMFFSGLLHVLVSKRSVTRFLGKGSRFATVKAALLGVPLPLCSCAVVPTAVTLAKNGASSGAVTAFLISTPQTGIDSIIATYGLMGPVFALFRPLAAFLSGIIGGSFVQFSEALLAIRFKGKKPSADREAGGTPSPHPGSGTASQMSPSPAEPPAATEASNPHPHTAIGCPHGTCSLRNCPADTDDLPRGAKAKFKALVRFGFLDFTEEMVWELIGGMAVAALISTFVDKAWVESLAITHGFPALLLMVLIGIPMYVCATSSIPLGITFLNLGFSPGAVFAFLFAGPVTNIASISVLKKSLGKRILALYLFSVFVLSLFFGWLLDTLVSAANLLPLIEPFLQTATPTHAPTPMQGFKIIGAAFFSLLLLRGMILRLASAFRRLSRPGSHNHVHDHEHSHSHSHSHGEPHP